MEHQVIIPMSEYLKLMKISEELTQKEIRITKLQQEIELLNSTKIMVAKEPILIQEIPLGGKVIMETSKQSPKETTQVEENLIKNLEGEKKEGMQPSPDFPIVKAKKPTETDIAISECERLGININCIAGLKAKKAVLSLIDNHHAGTLEEYVRTTYGEQYVKYAYIKKQVPVASPDTKVTTTIVEDMKPFKDFKDLLEEYLEEVPKCKIDLTNCELPKSGAREFDFTAYILNQIEETFLIKNSDFQEIFSNSKLDGIYTDMEIFCERAKLEDIVKFVSSIPVKE